MDVDAKQPPNEKERDDGQEKVAEPLAWRAWPAEVEHAAMVARESYVLNATVVPESSLSYLTLLERQRNTTGCLNTECQRWSGHL